MINRKERYIVKCFDYDGEWVTAFITSTHDKALKTINDFKKNGKEYKYRIIKQTIQEEVVYNEL